MHNGELHDLCSSWYIVWVMRSWHMRWMRHGAEVKCIKEFGGGPEGKRLSARHWHRWEDNIEINLKK